MFGSTVLEVVIGLVFLYLALSLICSAVNEYYSALLWRRATHLRDSLFLIFNKDDPKGLAFLLDFYTHPLISGLSGSTPMKRSGERTSSRDLVLPLPWYQKAVVGPAKLVAILLSGLAGLAGTTLNILGWIASAIRDPLGVGGFLSGLRKELTAAARATPNYIPDHAFSGAIFAVLASDSGVLRRLQVELITRFAALDQIAKALPDPDAANAFATRLDDVGRKVRDKVAAANSPDEILKMAGEEFARLLDVIPVDDPSYQPALDLIDRQIAAIAPGPFADRAQSDRTRTTLAGGAQGLADAAGNPVDGATKRDLIRLLDPAAKTSWSRGLPTTEAYLAGLRKELVDREKARIDARERISEALHAVLAVGPRLPTPEQVRDHVWTTLEASLQRLDAAFARLPAGPLQVELVKKVKQASDGIAEAKDEAPRSLKQAQDFAAQAFTSIREALVGFQGQGDWTKAVALLQQEVSLVASSEGDLITLAKLRNAVAALPESSIRSALLSFMDEVGDDLDKVKRNIEVWYNDSMERVSGWYKRNTQIIVSIIAVVIAGTLNADTIAIAKRLWTDSNLRATVNAVAKSVEPSSFEGKKPDDTARSKDSESAASDLNKATKKMLDDSGLPLGWHDEDLKGLGFDDKILKAIKAGNLPNWNQSKITGRRVLGNLFGTPAGLLKLLGLALTAIAVSMGAPFWFDVLNKLVNVRTSGLQPQKTADKPPAARPTT